MSRNKRAVMNRAAVNALLRTDFPSFVQRCFQTVVPGQEFLPNWHTEAMCYRLELCRKGKIRRLIITLPPRSGKSICASVAWPAFLLGHNPRLRIVCVSYSQELTAKHARDFRAVLESSWYQKLFPQTRINPRKNTEGEIETTAGGYRLATSVGGTLTGRGGNIIIIDDSMKPADALSEVKRNGVNEWCGSTLFSRLDRKTEDVIVIVQQRLHVDDLVGHVLERGDWNVLNLPAIALQSQRIAIGDRRFYNRREGEVLHPAREPLSVLEELKIDMGSQVFSAQYQQAPIPAEGVLIKVGWLRYYDDLPTRGPNDRIIQSWDTATSLGPANDYSACTTWFIHGMKYFLIDVYRARLENPALLNKIESHARMYESTAVLIEEAGIGKPLLQNLRQRGRVRAIGVRPEGDKKMRLEGQSAVIEAGHVLLPRRAPWLDDFRNEILAFPGGRHDDQADSLSQFLVWAARRRRRRFGRAYFFTPGSGRGVYVAGGGDPEDSE